VDREDGNLECFIPAASEQDLTSFQYLFSSTTRDDMSDGHLWFSLVSRPTRSRFTRVQRLSAGLALLFATMIANAMWYRSDDNVENKQVTLTLTCLHIRIITASADIVSSDDLLEMSSVVLENIRNVAKINHFDW
jgi:hypothetical protein